MGLPGCNLDPNFALSQENLRHLLSAFQGMQQYSWPINDYICLPVPDLPEKIGSRQTKD